MVPKLAGRVNADAPTARWTHWSELSKQGQRERLAELQEFLADLSWCRALEQEFEAQVLEDLDEICAAAQERLNRVA